jgi:hypothetical protein
MSILEQRGGSKYYPMSKSKMRMRKRGKILKKKEERGQVQGKWKFEV